MRSEQVDPNREMLVSDLASDFLSHLVVVAAT
jgi:hypothetical protein